MYPRKAGQLRKAGSTALISDQLLDLNWGRMFEYGLSVRFAAALSLGIYESIDTAYVAW